MNLTVLKNGFLSSTWLKILALIFMTVDHAGMLLFGNNTVMRIIGRLAFPIFAFFIAEGCRCTSNRVNYFLRIFTVGFISQVVYSFFNHTLYLNIFLTFSVSVLIIYSLDASLKSAKKTASLWPFATIAFVVAFHYLLLKFLPANLSYNFDYSLPGIFLPVFAYLSDKKYIRIALFSLGLILVCVWQGGIQYWSLLSVPLLMLYSGKPGKIRLKYLFYLYYPLHLLLLYFLSLFL